MLQVLHNAYTAAAFDQSNNITHFYIIFLVTQLFINDLLRYFAAELG
jgi:hypothetical protein